MVNNIKNNTISEISAKKDLNTLNEIKNAEIIKYKKRTLGQKELLDLFNNLLDTISTNKTLKSESQENKILMSSKDENENKKKKENEIKNENENENTLMLSKDENKNENKNDNENEDDDETIS